MATNALSANPRTDGDAVRPARSRAASPRSLARQAEAAEARLEAGLAAQLDAADLGEAEAEAAKETARLIGMQLVRSILAESGLTLNQLSARSGVAAETISRLATGRRATGPALWTLLALAEAAEVPLSVALAGR